MGSRLLYTAAIVALLAVPAQAQRGAGNYDVKELNFDLWCQEDAGLSPERCDKRSPEDEATFEAYRAKVEQYEIPYLQEKDNNARLDRDILHNDPVDNPVTNNPQQQQQDPNQPPLKSPP